MLIWLRQDSDGKTCRFRLVLAAALDLSTLLIAGALNGTLCAAVISGKWLQP